MKALGFLPVGDIGRIVGPGEGATHTREGCDSKHRVSPGDSSGEQQGSGAREAPGWELVPPAEVWSRGLSPF